MRGNICYFIFDFGKRAQYLKDILCDEHSKIDLVWLADLYLSDSVYYDIQVTIKKRI